MKRTITLALSLAVTCIASSAFAVGNVVVSQIYGGGGNTGAPWTNDYVEIHNRSGGPVNVSGWSVQYASATGSSWSVQAIPAATILPAGSYGLIKLATGGAVGTPLVVACQIAPAGGAAGSINMSATAGRVALTSNAVALTGTCPTGGAIVDFVGYGTTANCNETANAPAASNTTALQRKNAGGLDTDNNSTDFTTGSAVPCSLPTPARSNTWGQVKTIYR